MSGDADGRYTLFAAEKDGIATIWLYSTRTGKLTPVVQGTTPTWQP